MNDPSGQILFKNLKWNESMEHKTLWDLYDIDIFASEGIIQFSFISHDSIYKQLAKMDYVRS